jgi:hypothetical protein
MRIQAVKLSPVTLAVIAENPDFNLAQLADITNEYDFNSDYSVETYVVVYGRVVQNNWRFEILTSVEYQGRFATDIDQADKFVNVYYK